MVDVAIIADDLTGALDAASPFAARGRRVEAAVSAAAVAEIDVSADVITVNAATRDLPGEQAASIVRSVTERIVDLRPRILFKKIDSTLRGNIAPESRAVANAARRHRMIVCPAVPDQGRIVRSGELVLSGQAGSPAGDGRPIRPLFETSGPADGLRICDSADGADLMEVAERVLREASGTIAVGAAGLAGALAAKLYGARCGPVLTMTAPGLFVVGSRAAATLAQLQELDGDPRVATRLVGPDCPTAALPRDQAEIEVLRPEPETVLASSALVADRIAAAAARRCEELAPGTLFLCGGHIAERCLAALGTRTMSVVAEVEPGVPVARASICGRSTWVVTKAGGFGDAGCLVRLADRLKEQPEPEKRRHCVS
ncbi:four-carbon acid sugar kinase family protein [Microbaculum marinum]|uniref:Four-carbon acid sugar kinase family protein n=1 Tax=Microbaculum marinum TaxID=1764581 RepID=A0AAW9RNP0_9HYPH